MQGKKDLLSQIALITFERGDYFFKRKEIEQYISDYIHHLPDAQNNPEALQLDSEAVLKSIEAQHGLLVERAQNIYSFSHLTFQEYFTAKKFVERADWQNLVSHITEYRWQEVFLLAVTMIKSADELLRLMKKKIDALIALDEKLQQFLIWVSQKSCSVEVPYKPVAVRAFYMGYDLDVFRVFARDLDLNLDAQLDIVLAFKLELPPNRDLKLELKLDRNLAIELYLDCALGLSVVRTHAFYLALDLAVDVAPELAQALEELKGQLLGLNSDTEIKEILKQWEEKKGQAWTEQLRAVMIKHRNIGHDWHFNEQQKELLEQYYEANMLLVDCLNSDCEVSCEVRQKIEDTLLLPICEIKE
ncbi:NACHT domain-containing protein [Microcoleus sp. FACHB-672]|uniref:NACHT domain-containing protein n=1 Tax=Microcoleus sp. FACHB-672 TaxID=2692825 RepID=UPI001F54AA6C|nr:hypothetical protein [Microcoleus sp. FACHB-672]